MRTTIIKLLTGAAKKFAAAGFATACRAVCAVVLAATALLQAGCTEPIEIETGEMEPKLVIHGTMIKDEFYQSLQIKISEDYFNSTGQHFINDADVKVYTPDGKVHRMTNIDQTYGWYFFYNSMDERMNIEPGELTLEIDIDEEANPGFGSHLRITEIVPEPVQIDSISLVPSRLLAFDVYNLYLHFQDPPNEKNYYAFILEGFDAEGNSKFRTEEISTITLMADTAFDGQYVEMTPSNYKSSEVTYPGGNSPGEIVISPGDRIRLQLLSISEGYYNFVDQCQRASNSTNPFFGGPPANISTNIPGGFGYFTGSCATSATATVPELR